MLPEDDPHCDQGKNTGDTEQIALRTSAIYETREKAQSNGPLRVASSVERAPSRCRINNRQQANIDKNDSPKSARDRGFVEGRRKRSK